ncbi:MAG: hypothetical protein JWO36_4139, partial [Myxococcales bacterium]|nr:hypothetical protein [Myxococcales bacterium]
PGDRLWVRETHAFKSLDANKYLYGSLATLGLRAYGGAPPTPGCNLRWQSGDAMVHYAAHPTSMDELQRSPGYSTYRSDSPERWRPSIFMPRWASRISLDVTSVRVERLQDITEEDARAEGVDPLITTRKVYPSKHAADVEHASYRDGFARLWDSINGSPRPMLDDDGEPVLDDHERQIMVASRSWASNPWVWVVGFKRIEAATRAA